MVNDRVSVSKARIGLVVALAVPASATPPGQNGLLVWAREGGGLPNVWVANPDGSAQRRLFAKKGSGRLEGTFSPTDADLMFFTRFSEKPFSDDIWRPTRFPSPDGTRIVFTSDRDRRGRERLNPGFELYTMAVDGSDIVRVTNNRQLDLFPDWQRLP